MPRELHQRYLESIKCLYPEGGPGRQLKKRLKDGELLIGAQMSEFVRPVLAAQYMSVGLDFLYVEFEHFFFSHHSLVDTVLAARSFGLPVVSKTPHLSRGDTQRLLDTGVVGLMIPSTDSREDLERLKSWMKFPPAGVRNLFPGLGNSSYAKPDDYKVWMTQQDDESLVIAMIESRQGYERAEEIISTPGLDMVYMGYADFTAGLGLPFQYDHPEVDEAFHKVLRICQRYNVPFGISYLGKDFVRKWIDRGAQFFLGVDDMSFVQEGAQRLANEFASLSGRKA